VFPNLFLRPMEPAINKVIDRVHSRQGAVVSTQPSGAEAQALSREVSSND
jgi:hypothetical protein